MNLLEYLILGFLVVMAIGTWVLSGAIRRAEDGFENEQGFQLGIAPPVQSLYSVPTYAPAAPARAAFPEITLPKPPRRPPSSKPPMLPVGLTAADLDTRQTGAPWQRIQPAGSNPPVSSKAQAPAPGTPDSPSRP